MTATAQTAGEREIAADAVELPVLHAAPDGPGFARLEQALGWEFACRLVAALTSRRSCRL